MRKEKRIRSKRGSKSKEENKGLEEKEGGRGNRSKEVKED